MKVHEILTESKTQKAEAPKPRNFVAKNAINTGAGAHKDKKKAAKQGDVKHKKQAVTTESGLQYHTGVKKHGKEYMVKAAAAGRKGASQKELGALKDKYSKAYKENSVALPDIRGLGYDAQSLIMKLRRDVEDKRLQPTRQAVLSAARELAGDMDFAPELLVRQVLGQGVAEGRINEKAKSKAQQKFMGMVYAAKKGEKPASPEVAKVAKGMSKKSAKDYAQTKHKGKPEHVKETATAGATSAANVAVGAVYKNKKPKMQKPGTNALDMKGGNLMTGGSIRR